MSLGPILKTHYVYPSMPTSATQLRAAASYLERMKEERSTAINSSDSSRVPEPQTRPTHDLLIDAIRNYDEVRVEQLLSLGVDINRDFEGLTPVAHAVELRDYSIVARLLAAGADPDIPTRYSIHYVPPETARAGALSRNSTAARYFTQFQIKTST